MPTASTHTLRTGGVDQSAVKSVSCWTHLRCHLSRGRFNTCWARCRKWGSSRARFVVFCRSAKVAVDPRPAGRFLGVRQVVTESTSETGPGDTMLITPAPIAHAFRLLSNIGCLPSMTVGATGTKERRWREYMALGSALRARPQRVTVRSSTNYSSGCHAQHRRGTNQSQMLQQNRRSKRPWPVMINLLHANPGCFSLSPP